MLFGGVVVIVVKCMAYPAPIVGVCPGYIAMVKVMLGILGTLIPVVMVCGASGSWVVYIVGCTPYTAGYAAGGAVCRAGCAVCVARNPMPCCPCRISISSVYGVNNALAVPVALVVFGYIAGATGYGNHTGYHAGYNNPSPIKLHFLHFPLAFI